MKIDPRFRQQLRVIAAGLFLFACIVGAAAGMGLLFSLVCGICATLLMTAWEKHRKLASQSSSAQATTPPGAD